MRYSDNFPLDSFRNLSQEEQVIELFILVDKVMSTNSFQKARYREDTGEIDYYSCYLESLLTRLGVYDEEGNLTKDFQKISDQRQ